MTAPSQVAWVLPLMIIGCGAGTTAVPTPQEQPAERPASGPFGARIHTVICSKLRDKSRLVPIRADDSRGRRIVHDSGRHRSLGIRSGGVRPVDQLALDDLAAGR